MAEKNAKQNNLMESPEKSKEVVMSYIFAVSRRDTGVYSERLLLRLVELAQSSIEGLDFRHDTDLRKVDAGDYAFRRVSMPISSLITGNHYKNYEYIKDAIKKLENTVLEYEDEHVWKSRRIISDPTIEKNTGKVNFNVSPEIWSVILDFSKGFRAIDLKVAFRFQNKNSLRFYTLMSRQKTPFTMKIVDIKEMLGIANKYSRNSDFINRVIKPVQKDLDENSPYTFTYTVLVDKNQEKGRKKSESITFTPVHQMSKDTLTAAVRPVSPNMLLSIGITDILKNKFGFTTRSINANKTLLHTADRNFDLADFLTAIAPNALRASNPQGYVIASIKKHLSEDYDIDFSDDKKATIILETKA